MFRLVRPGLRRPAVRRLCPLAAQSAPPPPPDPLPSRPTSSSRPRPQPEPAASARRRRDGDRRAPRSRASKATTVLDLLRTVPGLDVVQSGGAGTVTSLFLRGTNSTQTLVLVDGVPLNSPYFGGTDLSAVSTANVERVEVVRGPFSALYGSEAIGGVVQIFTRRDAPEKALEGRATGAFGNASAAQGTADVAVHEGPFTVTGGWRRVTDEGALPNESFAATNLSGAVEASLGGGSRVGVVLRRDSAVTGIPFSAGVPTPQRKTTSDMTTLAVPATVTLGPKTTVEASLLFARGRPTYSDPDDPYGFTFSESDERRSGGRLVATHDFGAQRLSFGSDYSWTNVTELGLVRRPARRRDDANLVALCRGPDRPRRGARRRHGRPPPRRQQRVRRALVPARDARLPRVLRREAPRRGRWGVPLADDGGALLPVLR